MEIRFEWDHAKAVINKRRHGVSFEDAKHTFADPHVVLVEDCEADGEMRYHAIGYAAGELLLTVVHTDRSDEEQEIIRIISARKANNYEQSTYADQFA